MVLENTAYPGRSPLVIGRRDAPTVERNPTKPGGIEIKEDMLCFEKQNRSYSYPQTTRYRRNVKLDDL